MTTWKFTHKPAALLTAALFGMILLTIWSYGQLRGARGGATLAANDFITCRQLANDVTGLANRPTMAHSQQIHINELTRHIEQSTKNANISPDSLVRIWPEPPIRVGDSPYQKKSTQVLFREVTLQQLITFLHHAASHDGGPRPTHIRLLAPRNNESGNRWTAETTLTYLIYAPKTTS